MGAHSEREPKTVTPRAAESRMLVTAVGEGSYWLMGAQGLLGKLESPGGGGGDSYLT